MEQKLCRKVTDEELAKELRWSQKTISNVKFYEEDIGSLNSLTGINNEDEETELIIIYDDISLDVGQLRIRKKGSAGGHNGIKSIIQHLGGDVFPRIKMGVGEKPKGYDLADYVLGHFKKEERIIMDESIVTASKAIELMVIDEIGEAMNLYNKKAKLSE